MLILSRRVGEEIVLPSARLTISVLGTSSSRVRLGFIGPPEVTVQRKEVWERATNAKKPCEFSDPANGGCAPSARVLIADADDCLRESYRTCLEGQGFVVIGAASGLECVARLRDSSPDILVLDPAVPWGGGDGVLAMMDEEPDVPRVPVIVVASHLDRGVLYRLAPFGIDDFHVKPLRANPLAERIRAVLRRRSAEGQPAVRQA